LATTVNNSSAPPKPSLRRAFAINFFPALLLWCLASLLLGGYYCVAPFHAALNELAEIKLRFGLLFVMPAQVFAAAILPLFLQKLQSGGGKANNKNGAPQILFLMLYWAFQGALTNKFYDVQAQIFGDVPTITAILCKTAVDMLIYTLFICMPLLVLSYALKDNGFSWQSTRRALGRNWFVTRAVPLYYAALLVWCPTVLVLYALPLALQFPVQAIVQCFWGLIIMFMTRRQQHDQRAETTAPANALTGTSVA
jgi:hypothetical protein